MNFSMILAQTDAAIGEAPAVETPSLETPLESGAGEQAEVAVPQGGAQQQPAPMDSSIKIYIYMGLFLVLMYFMMIRPQRRREKERQALLAALKSGDRVLFAGGFIGTVANVKEKILVVKIADNVKVEIARGAVSQVLGKGEAPSEEKQA